MSFLMQLRIDGIDFSYGKNEILKKVYLELKETQLMGILGPNGSGKTTMLRCINGILTPQQGSIVLDEKELKDMPRSEVAKNIGYVPQNSSSDLCSPTVYEVVLMGRKPHITWQFSNRDKDIVWEAMEEMDVKDLASQRFDRLSSGQTQRVLMARAIAQEAHVLLLDEPTSNLDVKYQIEVMDRIHRLVHKNNISGCAVIHDLDLAMRFCDKAVLLNKGNIVAAGDVWDVITPENIKKVYDMDIAIPDIYGRPRVVVL